LTANSTPVGRPDANKKHVQQLVVMASGEVRVPPMGSEVAHGHHPPDQHIKIVMPANKPWLLLEVEVQLENAG
jgi:hypothetical protein